MGAIETTIDKIKQMLVDGELRPGDKLPVEKDLAALPRRFPQHPAGGGPGAHVAQGAADPTG